MNGGKLLAILKPLAKTSDELVDFLMPCIIPLIIEPRFKIIAVLEFIFEAMKSSKKWTNEKIDNLENECKNWILRWDISIGSDKFFPDNVDKMFRDSVDKNIMEIIFEFQDIMPDPRSEEIENRKFKLISKWENPGTIERIIKPKIVEQSINNINQRPLDTWGTIGRNQSFAPTGLNIKTGVGDFEGTDTEMRNTDRLRSTARAIDIRNMISPPEVYKNDADRLESLYDCYETLGDGVKITADTRSLINQLWHGNFYDQSSFDNFVDYSTNHNIKIKIKDRMIKPEVSRLILQSYLIGLVMGSSVSDIYINFRCVATKTIHGYVPNPRHVHVKEITPNKEVEKVLNNMLLKMNIDPRLDIIRSRWKNMKFPKIDTTDLINYVRKNNKDEGDSWSFRMRLESVVADQDLGMSKEAFQKKVSGIINGDGYKGKLDIYNDSGRKITHQQITALLKYKT